MKSVAPACLLDHTALSNRRRFHREHHRFVGRLQPETPPGRRRHCRIGSSARSQSERPRPLDGFSLEFVLFFDSRWRALRFSKPDSQMGCSSRLISCSIRSSNSSPGSAYTASRCRQRENGQNCRATPTCKAIASTPSAVLRLPSAGPAMNPRQMHGPESVPGSGHQCERCTATPND